MVAGVNVTSVLSPLTKVISWLWPRVSAVGVAVVSADAHTLTRDSAVAIAKTIDNTRRVVVLIFQKPPLIIKMLVAFFNSFICRDIASLDEATAAAGFQAAFAATDDHLYSGGLREAFGQSLLL